MKEEIEFILGGFWRFCGFTFLLYMVLYFVVNGVLRVTARVLRSINIAARGWPPAHLDADGDSIKSTTTDINPLT